MSEFTVTQSISLDVLQANSSRVVLAKQNDYASRFLCVRITQKGTAMNISDENQILFGVRRSDGQRKAFFGEVNSDGTANIKFPPWLLEVIGKHTCDVGVLKGADLLLSTMPFTVEVVEAPCTDDVIVEEEDPSIIAIISSLRGEGPGAIRLGTDLHAPGDYAFAQGYGETIREADSSSAGAYFDALQRIGVVEGEAGAREVKAGVASGYCAVSLLNAIVPGDYALGGGRGTYVNGRGATGLGYEIVIDAQDGTSIGQRNFIIDFRAGCAVGYGLVMNPDGNAHGDLTPSNGFLFGCYSEMHADSSLLAGIYGNICHENVYGMGRRIVSAGDRQLLLAFAPNAEADTLLAVGDGDDAGKNPHNFIHILQDRTTGFASSGYIDIPTLTIGPGNSILHKHVFGMGTGLVSAADDQILFGRYPKVGTAHLLVVGNGSKNALGNVLEIYKDGKRTYLNTSLGVGEASSLSFSGNMYQGCLIAGRGITATNNWQTIVGSYPKLPQYSLFVVGDGTKGSPSNAMYIACNADGKATIAQVNCRINCDMKISAGDAPTEDNDVIRLLEHKALQARVAALEEALGLAS